MLATEATGKAIIEKPSQGRPLGFLVAWCRIEGDRRKCRLQKEHLAFQQSHEERTQARDWLKALDDPIVAALLGAERAKRDWEDDEPVIPP